MKKISQTLTFIMITSMLLLPVAGHAVSANASGSETIRHVAYLIHYVKPGGSGNCLSWETACDLQEALSKIPDQIWVAAGVYKPTTTGDRAVSFELESGVKIFGGFPPDGGAWETRDWEANVTILSGDIGTEGDDSDNSYHVVSADGVNRLAVLDGFTITGGYSSGDTHLEPISYGGGMHNLNSNPILTNLNFIGNKAKYGAGMYNDQSSPEMTNVTFSGNVLSAGGRGVGMYNFQCSSPTLNNVNFTENTGFYEGGGAMVNQTLSSPTLTKVTFTNNLGGGMVNLDDSNPTLSNVIFSGNSSMIGGGMKNESSNPELTDVVFNENAGSWGGGMFNKLSDPILTNVTFSGNTASDYNSESGGHFDGIGGAMYNQRSDPVITNVTFSENTASVYGGGMYNTDISQPLLTNVTFWGNTAGTSGGGIANIPLGSSSPVKPILINVILWGNNALTGAGIYNDDGGTPQISYSDIQGCGGSTWNIDCGVDGGNNIDADPLLGPLADNGGFTMTHALSTGSPAIDAGDPSNCPATDQRGVTRPQGDFCDMGAYEYEFPAASKNIFLPLIFR